jgi:AcrR family transcriptional regulator
LPPASRSPQRQRGRDRVAGLIAAATSLFLEKGYDATTMTEIASRAGASIGSLYLFFPTKPALAGAMLTQIGEMLTAQLDSLQARALGWPAARIADALFGELAVFLATQPVYAALIDVPGEGGWRQTVRVHRRAQIAALFAQADPPLPDGQGDRLAVIVPQLMRITMVVRGETQILREGVLDELRAMLRKHLE